MPKKPAKKTTKKVVAKSAPRKASPAMKSSAATSAVTMNSLRADQDSFHMQHPYANTLIGLFIFAFCMLVVVYLFSGSMS